LSPRSRRERGFTLQELMAVVTILGVIAAIGASRMGARGRGSRDSQAWARRVTSTLEQARSRAVATRRVYRVTVSPGELRVESSPDRTVWTLEQRQQAPSEALVWDTRTVAGAPGTQSAVPHTIELNFDFTVRVDGSATNDNANIYIAGRQATLNHAGTRYRIQVLPSGTVRMLEGW
jgi:prepilin-type N-terminal cleavage/methylation domain-containing protein